MEWISYRNPHPSYHWDCLSDCWSRLWSKNSNQEMCCLYPDRKPLKWYVAWGKCHCCWEYKYPPAAPCFSSISRQKIPLSLFPSWRIWAFPEKLLLMRNFDHSHYLFPFLNAPPLLSIIFSFIKSFGRYNPFSNPDCINWLFFCTKYCKAWQTSERDI